MRILQEVNSQKNKKPDRFSRAQIRLIKNNTMSNIRKKTLAMPRGMVFLFTEY